MNDGKSISKKRKILTLIILFILLALVFFISISVGATNYSIDEIINNDTAFKIIIRVRLPRIILSALVGICLSLSGCILQSVMRNSLASPSTIGVTAGASFMGYILLVAFPKYAILLPIGTFLGSVLTTIFIYIIAYKDGVSPIKMILSGLCVSAFLGAFNDIIKIFFADNLPLISGFLVGGFNGTTWGDIKMILPYAIIGISSCIFLPSKMNILMLGDESANSLGLNTEKFRFVLIIIASLLAGISVSVAGIIGFVGLVVPHMARIFVGSDYKYLLPTSMIFGALLLMMCDTIGRVIILPAEMPVSIITAFIGAPFFLVLLRSKKYY